MDQLDFEALRRWEHEQQAESDADEANEADESHEAECDAISADAIIFVLQLILVPTSTGSVNWRASFRRLAAMGAWALPEVGRDSLLKIAKQITEAGLPTSRAALSAINTYLCDKTGFRRTEKTARVRELYRRRALEFWRLKIR